MRLHIKNGRVIDPASGKDGAGDVFIVDGKISNEGGKADKVIDAKGLVVAPGLIDLSARLREPGLEYKATLASEMDAAVAGGVTSLACPPDTDPPLDEPGLVDMLRRRAKSLERARVYPVGALTVKLQGEALTEMGLLADAGCVAFSQANVPLADTQVLWRALQYAATFGFSVWLRVEDAWLAKNGVSHDGDVATRLGLPGIPAFAETIALATLLELVRATRARVHVCRLSSAGAVEMMRAAKKEGLPVSCDVGIHHVHLCDRDLGYFDPNCRLEPPLRSPRDRDALSQALADGAIDCVCSDHTPVDEDGKHLPFAEAEAGATGLELLLPLTLKWGATRKLSLAQTLSRITAEPARILGTSSGRLAAGAPGDLVLFDPQASFRVSAEALKSQGKNTPFIGYELQGKVRATIVAGNVVYEG
ncbi:dihydroorotase [Betaproteobacteria bacterium SCGC AG-212-J23]|nr:dihydroorotase [Betaproteobacteria bacterium SCGC AG-212-J23]